MNGLRHLFCGFRRKLKNQKGVALLFSLLLTVIIIGMLAIGAQLIVTSLRETHGPRSRRTIQSKGCLRKYSPDFSKESLVKILKKYILLKI